MQSQQALGAYMGMGTCPGHYSTLLIMKPTSLTVPLKGSQITEHSVHTVLWLQSQIET